MPLEIIHGDISNLSFRVDAIVTMRRWNADGIGDGVDRAICNKAGEHLLSARKNTGAIVCGQSVFTDAYGMRDKAKYIVHTLPPEWREGQHGEEETLRSCYDSALEIAWQHQCKSIAFPLIGSGNMGFPIKNAYKVATDAFRDFCEDHELDIYLVVFDENTVTYCKRQRKVVDDDNQPGDVKAVLAAEYHEADSQEDARTRIQEASRNRNKIEDKIDGILDDAKENGKNICETLYDLVNWTVEKRFKMKSYAEFCRKANLGEKHFSNHIAKKGKEKTKSKPDKRTLLAYAIALEMNSKQVRQLMELAGYLFSEADIRDEQIIKFVDSDIFDVFAINEQLRDMGLEEIGQRNPKEDAKG